MPRPLRNELETLYQTHSRRVLATLIRLLGDFDLAEEALQEAFAAALVQWPAQGIPDNPAAWLISAGRHKGIDQIRRRRLAGEHARHQPLEEPMGQDPSAATIDDDQLRLIFTCCHPALGLEAQVALTLREMCGLSNEQVASALLQQPATVAQRIVRAKRKIRDAGIPYEVPEPRALGDRLQSVLKVVYLVFNEGYSRSEGEQVLDVSLAAEAIRLGGLLAQLLPEGEVLGLLALMLLHDSRKGARTDTGGDLITLEDQDRSLWDRRQIEAGTNWLLQALHRPPVGPYTLQAAIAAVHAEAGNVEETDWAQIAGLYDVLYRQWPSPVVALNRAVAIAMRDHPPAGLALLDQLAGHKAIQNYHLFHAARADLHRRAGQHDAARAAYERALQLVRQGPEQRFLARRLAALEAQPEK